MNAPEVTGPQFAPGDTVDFAIVGSGAAGGVVARELARAGFRVVVLEQGPYFTQADFHHDEVDVFLNYKLAVNQATKPVTYRKTPDEKATARPYLVYGVAVGGGTVHFTANYWRFRPIDFRERSTHGEIPGTSISDVKFVTPIASMPGISFGSICTEYSGPAVNVE